MVGGKTLRSMPPPPNTKATRLLTVRTICVCMFVQKDALKCNLIVEKNSISFSFAPWPPTTQEGGLPSSPFLPPTGIVITRGWHLMTYATVEDLLEIWTLQLDMFSMSCFERFTFDHTQSERKCDLPMTHWQRWPFTGGLLLICKSCFWTVGPRISGVFLDEKSFIERI